jgi:hypothetical protein
MANATQVLDKLEPLSLNILVLSLIASQAVLISTPSSKFYEAANLLKVST